ERKDIAGIRHDGPVLTRCITGSGDAYGATVPHVGGPVTANVGQCRIIGAAGGSGLRRLHSQVNEKQIAETVVGGMNIARGSRQRVISAIARAHETAGPSCPAVNTEGAKQPPDRGPTSSKPQTFCSDR